MHIKMQMSEQALTVARAQEDWNTLWLQAVPIAKFAIRRMGNGRSRAIDADVLQDTLLALGQAVRRWEPARGKFSTFVYSWAHGSALKSIAAAARERVDTCPDYDIEYDASPEGLGDPAEQEGESDVALHAEALLLQVHSDEDREMLRRLYGIGRPKINQQEYAKESGLNERTVRRRLRNLLRYMSGLGIQAS